MCKKLIRLSSRVHGKGNSKALMAANAPGIEPAGAECLFSAPPGALPALLRMGAEPVPRPGKQRLCRYTNDVSDPRQTPASPPKKYRESRMIRLRQGMAAALLVLTAALLLFWWRDRAHPAHQRAKILPVGLTVRQTAHGFSLSRSEGGKPVFRIYADQAVQLKQGSQATLKNVRIDLYSQDGIRADQIYGQAFAYDPATGIVTAQGLVHIDLGGIPGQPVAASGEQAPGEEAGRPIHIQTNDMVFNTRTGIGEVRKGLDFAYLGAQGKADRAHVTTHPDVLTLQGHVQLHWTRSDGPPVEVTSDSARLDKLAALVELDGNASVATGPQHLHADRLQFLLRPDYSVRQALAIGHVTGIRQDSGRTLNAQAAQAQAFFVAPAGTPSGRAVVHPGQAMQLTSLRLEGGAELRETAPQQQNRLTAGAIALRFDANGVLQKMEARQNARLSLVASAATAGPSTRQVKELNLGGAAGSRSISAPGLDFFFNSGKSGKSIRIRQLQSVGRAHIESRDSAASWMTADANQFSLGFDAGQRPLRSEASGDVLLKQQPAPEKGRAQPLQISQSDHLLLEFLPAQNRLKDAVQQGHVQLQQAGRRVRADLLRYDPVSGVALLQSEAASAFTHGQVFGEDASLRFRSPQARLSLQQDRVEGWGGVQISFLPGATPPASQSGPMFHARLPVDITADRMNVLEKAGRGTFSGNVRLWQGQNLTLARAMTFDRATGDVLATGDVVSAFVQPASDKGSMPHLLSNLPGKTSAEASGSRHASPISITADRLSYSDAKHQGTYLGHVVLTSAQARLTAGKLQFDLAPAATKTGEAGPAVLQRVIATEDVKITQPGREAKAQRVVYDMAVNRITMQGGPPSIYDAEHGYLTGETLTFSPSNDTIRVESEPGKRTFGEYRVKH